MKHIEFKIFNSQLHLVPGDLDKDSFDKLFFTYPPNINICAIMIKKIFQFINDLIRDSWEIKNVL